MRTEPIDEFVNDYVDRYRSGKLSFDLLCFHTRLDINRAWLRGWIREATEDEINQDLADQGFLNPVYQRAGQRLRRHPKELREEVLAMEGSCQKVADNFGISPSTVYYWRKVAKKENA